MENGDCELYAAIVAVEALLLAIDEGVWEGLPPLGGLTVHAECLRRSLQRMGAAIRARNGQQPEEVGVDRFGVVRFEKWVMSEGSEESQVRKVGDVRGFRGI